MIKSFLTFVVPFVFPTIAYILWVYFRQEREDAAAQGRRLPPWRDYPWTWLVTLGAVLAVVTVVLIGSLGGAGTNTEYHPARYEDGKLIPGDFIDKDTEARE